MLRFFTFAFACCAATQTLTTAAADASHIRATLRSKSGATQYRQGELIEVQLQFTSDKPKRFSVFNDVGNRWSGIPRDEFHVTPATGAIDPLALYEKPFLFNERRFSPNLEIFGSPPSNLPVTITLPLTDWLRFDRPGHYKVFLVTRRAFGLPAKPGAPQRALSLETNAVELDIIPADPAWQARQLKEIESQTPINEARLRALGTAGAACFLARQYRGNIAPFDREVLLGLLASPHREAGADEMRRLLRDPDYAVTASFLNALALLSVPPREATWPSIAAKLPALRQQLWNALPAKRGQALVISRQTYMAGLKQLAALKLSPDQIGQIIQTFEQLPPMDQEVWLGERWTQVSDPRWVPVFRKLALRGVNFRRPGNPDLYPDVRISKLALKRWYELDPQAARQTILREIESPAPRFGADALGILPDRVLPAEQHTIAAHYVSARPPAPQPPNRYDLRPGTTRQAAYAAYEAAESHLASLLFRYADGDVLPEVLPAIEKRATEGNCSAENYAIAYLLKVDPDEAASALRKVASYRPYGHTSCVQTMYSEIGALIASPVLDRFAIESLNDNDLIVATQALRYLRDHGSARAEQPIFDRLVRWNAKWRGHVSELTGTAGRPSPNLLERDFGMELAQTLVRGHGWLADERRIRQILSLTLEPNARMDLKAALSQARSRPIHIYFMGKNGPMFLVAQYQLDSMKDLENKLSQYSPGTVFVWADRRSPVSEILDHHASRELEEWSSAKGIHIEGL